MVAGVEGEIQGASFDVQSGSRTMIPLKCGHCGNVICVHDTVSVDSDTVTHLDCRRPRLLGHEERPLGNLVGQDVAGP